MEARKMSVKVAGRTYTLSTTEPSAQVERMVDLVNRTIAETRAASPNTDRKTAAVAAALSMASTLMKAQEDNTRLRRELAEQHEFPE